MAKLQRPLVLLAAVLFTGFGVWFLVAPQGLEGIGIFADGGSARTDIRATYGGFELGMAAFLFLCAGRVDWLRVGLVAATLTVGGFALGRGVGILIEGSAEPLMWFFLGIEAAYSAAGALCLRATRA